MKFKYTPHILVVLFPIAALAQDKCTEQGQAEQMRIQKDFTAQRPAKGDKEAELTWSKNLHAALAASAKRAEDCTRANKPPTAPAAAAKIDACLAGVRQKTDALHQRDRGRALTMQEQTARRAEEQGLQDEYMACTKK